MRATIYHNGIIVTMARRAAVSIMVRGVLLCIRPCKPWKPTLTLKCIARDIGVLG